MILLYLFLAFMGYLLFRFVVGFVLPVVRTTRRVRRSFRDMQERMHTQPQNSQRGYGQQQPVGKPKSKDEDYIEFEEVK